MDKQTVQEARAEAFAMDALIAVAGDNPHNARTALAGASFRDLALITAWADELGRLSKQTLADYENRERSEWREANQPVMPYERRTLNDVLMDHLRARRTFGDGWTSPGDVLLLVSPHTNAGVKELQDWVDGQLRTLVQEGVLSPEGGRPDEYRILSVPEAVATV